MQKQRIVVDWGAGNIIDYNSVTQQNSWIPSSLKDTDEGLAQVPKLFLQEEDSLQMKTAHCKNIDPAAAAKSLQSCPTLCNPIDVSPPGSPTPGILQARTLEWVAISFSNAWKWKVKVKLLSRVWLLATPWTAACQDPPSMGFSRQEYWSGVPLPSPFSQLVTGKTKILTPPSWLLREYCIWVSDLPFANFNTLYLFVAFF